MSLRFQCQSCQSEIVTKFLRVGEIARCKKCGAAIPVPETASIADDEVAKVIVSVPATVQSNPTAQIIDEILPSFAGKRAWNPVGIFWLGVCFSVLPAGILWGVNFGRLGQPERKKSSYVTTGLFSLLVLVMCLLPKLSLAMTIPVNLAMCSTYLNSQSTLYRNFLAKGGQRESFKRPLLLSSLFIVVLAISAFGFFYLDSMRYYTQYHEAVSLMERGNLIEAKSRLQRLEEENPDEPAAYYALSWIHQQDANFDSALNQLRRYVLLQPSDTLALERVRLLEDLLDHEPGDDSTS